MIIILILLFKNDNNGNDNNTNDGTDDYWNTANISNHDKKIMLNDNDDK